MNGFTSIIRANTGLVVTAAMCLAFPVVLALVGLMMRSAGASLRPVVFLAGLMLPIAIVLFVAELVRARQPGAPSESTFSLTVRDGHFADRAKLFGADLSPDDMRDAKAVFPEFFADAECAELGIVGTGETILVAQFPGSETAKRAAAFLWTSFRITGSSGSEETGWRGKRGPNGDFIELLRTGRQLVMWTALTREACAARRAAAPDVFGTADQPSAAREPLIAALQPLGALFRPTGVKVLGLLFMVALSTLWFFKGAAWASSTPAQAGVPVASAAELATRLEAINALDVPFQIERGERPDEFVATWRYADAKWVDLARAHGLRGTFRIRLAFDASARTVRATDDAASYDWSAGRSGARIEWQAVTGIVFFQTEQRRVFGLQLDEQGRFQPDLSYAYRFSSSEMKSPLIDAVTRAGWNWRPTIWQGPAWLRWLTE